LKVIIAQYLFLYINIQNVINICMRTTEIILISLAIVVVGVRLYQKYVKKNQGKLGSGSRTDSPLSSSSKDDDYEPYEKK
jgi:hypothetical protein